MFIEFVSQLSIIKIRMEKNLILILIVILQLNYMHCATNSCSTSPCKNGATCTPVNATSYNCSCADNFSGTTCSICNNRYPLY